MKVVVDCNVLISAGINNKGTCRQLISEVARNHEVFLSHEILDEYLRTIAKPHLSRHREKLHVVMELILREATFIRPISCLFRLPDPDDEIYLATALTVKADVLVTGNKKHFPLPRYGDVLILRPREFLDSIKSL